MRAGKKDVDLAARKVIDELIGIVRERLVLEEELANLEKSSWAQIASLENFQLEVKIATRAFPMNDYTKGKHVSWDVDKGIVNYVELC